MQRDLCHLFLQFNNVVQVIFSSSATVAIIVAYFLDCTLSRGQSSTRRDSGRQWWEKFRNFNKDTRSEEFYSLPYNLNRFFPSSWLMRSLLAINEELKKERERRKVNEHLKTFVPIAVNWAVVLCNAEYERVENTYSSG